MVDIFGDSGSEDHRGTPEAPGRVVTLIEYDQKEKVWGAAYLIAPEEVEATKSYLDLREINGYTIHTVPVHHNLPASESLPNPILTTVYIATPSNPQYVGPPTSTTALAKHILQSKGPSGENREYLYQLEEALHGLDEKEGCDEHVRELAKVVRDLERKMDVAVHIGRKSSGEVDVERRKGKEEDEMEEVEGK